MEFQDISLIKGYHVHVYFDESTLEQAKMLCEEAGKLFQVTVGRMHCKPVGPHPSWSCQLAIDRSGNRSFPPPKKQGKFGTNAIAMNLLKADQAVPRP